MMLQSKKFKFVRRTFRNRQGEETAFDIVVHPGAAVIFPVGYFALFTGPRHPAPA